MDAHMGNNATTGDDGLLGAWLADVADFLQSLGVDRLSTPMANAMSHHRGGAQHHCGSATPVHPGGAAPAHPVPDDYKREDDLGAPLELAPTAMRA